MGGLLAAHRVATDGAITLPVTQGTGGFGFSIGFQRDSAERKPQRDGENNGKQLYPHGVASSLAQNGAREVWREKRFKPILVPGFFRRKRVF